MMMSGEQNDTSKQEMLGDLPLLSSLHFRAQGYESWGANQSYEFGGLNTVTWRLRNFQYQLHRQGQKEDEVVLKSYGRTPYHPDILPRWEAFCKVTIQKEIDSDDDSQRPRKRREGLRSRAVEGEGEGEESSDEEEESNGTIVRTNITSFQIENIVLPPSPFFNNNLLPLLKKNTNLLSLELRGCDLGANEISCVAKFLKKNKSLATLDLSCNKINNVDAAKLLGYHHSPPGHILTNS